MNPMIIQNPNNLYDLYHLMMLIKYAQQIVFMNPMIIQNPNNLYDLYHLMMLIKYAQQIDRSFVAINDDIII